MLDQRASGGRGRGNANDKRLSRALRIPSIRNHQLPFSPWCTSTFVVRRARFLPLDGFRSAPGFIDNWKSYYLRSRNAPGTSHCWHEPLLSLSLFLSPHGRVVSSCFRWKKRQLTGYSRGGDPRHRLMKLLFFVRLPPGPHQIRSVVCLNEEGFLSANLPRETWQLSRFSDVSVSGWNETVCFLAVLEYREGLKRARGRKK